jgi:hypothetical protein
MCRARAILPVILLFLFAASFAPAQESAPAKRVDAAYVSDDFFAAIVVHPGRILKSPALKELPLDAAAAAMKEALGFEPRQIEQVMLLLSVMELKSPPRIPEKDFRGDPLTRSPLMNLHGIQPGVIIRFKEPLATKALVRRLAKAANLGEIEEVTASGKTYYLAARLDAAAHVRDDRTLVIALEPKLKNMLAAERGSGTLAERLRNVDASHDVIVAAKADAVRKILEHARSQATHIDEALPLDILMEAYKHLTWLTFTADLVDRLQFQWTLDAASAEGAELLNDLVRGWFAALKVVLPAVKKTFGEDHMGPTRKTVAGIVNGLLEPLVRAARVKRVEERVLVQLDFGKDYPTVLATMVRAVVEARRAALSSQSSNNLRQLALAMHVHHGTYNAFPSHASYSKKGKPLLSWRVHILPFLELTNLWAEFKHDEPWDSPHNKQLIPKMPHMFKNPGADLPEGKTCYLAPLTTDKKSPSIFLKGATDKNRGGIDMGDGRPKEVLGIHFREIADGTSNVIMIVEAAPEKAVVWTQPDDWEFNPAKPKDGLFGMWPDFTLAAYADGGIHHLSKVKLTEETLRRLVWRADGQPLELP